MASKFKLYEETVQSPKWQVGYLPQFHRWLTGKTPYSFREDFCGSGKISCEWVKKSTKNKAVGLDIDEEALSYAETVNKLELNAGEKKRVRYINQNVLKPTREKFDWVGAFNYSFFIFTKRSELLKYAKAVHRSLNKKGTFFLELAGGPGFQELIRTPQAVKVKGIGKVQQVWEQHPYDPITAETDFSIHFKLPDGTWMNDAFTYHWRLWQVRELREILADAGFKKTVVLWERNGQYIPSENAPADHSWVSYVIGVK